MANPRVTGAGSAAAHFETQISGALEKSRSRPGAHPRNRKSPLLGSDPANPAHLRRCYYTLCAQISRVRRYPIRPLVLLRVRLW
jgi:hypothetical protein